MSLHWTLIMVVPQSPASDNTTGVCPGTEKNLVFWTRHYLLKITLYLSEFSLRYSHRCSLCLCHLLVDNFLWFCLPAPFPWWPPVPLLASPTSPPHSQLATPTVIHTSLEPPNRGTASIFPFLERLSSIIWLKIESLVGKLSPYKMIFCWRSQSKLIGKKHFYLFFIVYWRIKTAPFKQVLVSNFGLDCGDAKIATYFNCIGRQGKWGSHPKENLYECLH